MFSYLHGVYEGEVLLLHVVQEELQLMRDRLVGPVRGAGSNDVRHLFVFQDAARVEGVDSLGHATGGDRAVVDRLCKRYEEKC